MTGSNSILEPIFKYPSIVLSEVIITTIILIGGWRSEDGSVFTDLPRSRSVKYAEATQLPIQG